MSKMCKNKDEFFQGLKSNFKTEKKTYKTMFCAIYDILGKIFQNKNFFIRMACSCKKLFSVKQNFLNIQNMY